MCWPRVAHARCSYTVCDILQSKFHDIVLPALSLDGADKDNQRFKLECLIRDVLVTRNLVAHGKLSVAEVKRGMQSLARLLHMLPCEASALQSACVSIDTCVHHVEHSCSASYSCHLSLGSLARLLLLRYCQCFCDAVGEPSDMQKAIDKMEKGKSNELDCQKLFVIKGRHDLYHGVSSGSCMSVLVALCALSSLLRNLRPEHAATADACNADILQLLEQMQLCDEGAILAAVAESHRST